MQASPYIAWLQDLSVADAKRVGAKNAAIGEMMRGLRAAGVRVPKGFAVTVDAYRALLEANGLGARLAQESRGLDAGNVRDVQRRGKKIRELILGAELPTDVADAIRAAYRALLRAEKNGALVAVRSSATAEDLPDASFAGQQDTYLNIRGEEAVLRAVKRCMASLFTDRAISYRDKRRIGQEQLAMAVGVQRMVRSDRASSGVMFTADPETGLGNAVVINAVYGLGESLAEGRVAPDEFTLFKPALAGGQAAVIAKTLGRKDRMAVFARTGTRRVAVPDEKRRMFSLSDDEARTLASLGVAIEQHFSAQAGRHVPMDIEWAKDGETGEIFIVQARPETVHSGQHAHAYVEYRLKSAGERLAEGDAIGTKIASGAVRVVRNPRAMGVFRAGEVLVTEATDPDWEPVMKKASALVTERGGRTSHAAIVARELGIPAVVGAARATALVRPGESVTVDCSTGRRGVVYRGAQGFKAAERRLRDVPETKTRVMLNIGSPDEAFRHHRLPVKGVGLGRIEFVIGSHIGVHPNALIHFGALKRRKDAAARSTVREIERRTAEYRDKMAYYVDKLSEGIARIGAAFWPHEVIMRFSDFKTNEYRSLVGGALFEPVEANPMIGWRGAVRYTDPRFKEAFGLECRAIKKVREDIGATNVAVMIPFCRTPEEGAKVVRIMAEHGLDRATDPTLKIYMMCEIPSNVIRANEFLDIFDGMSIGSNDLTQLALGIDRDAGELAHIGNENDPAVKVMIRTVIAACRARKKYVGICGQAPSDFPEFAEFLVEEGIESISLNPDAVVTTLPVIAAKEAMLRSETHT